MGPRLPRKQSVGEISDRELRKQLEAEVVALSARLQAQTGYQAPPYSTERLDSLIDEMLSRYPADARPGVRDRLRGAISLDATDPDVWKGVWYMLNYSLEYQTDILKRRFTGEYETDEWGLDMEFLQAIEPLFTFMYSTYWRVETSGMENVPEEGRALLVCNHSGQLPWDGVMLGTAIYNEHPAQRIVRNLYATWLPTLPIFSALVTKLGQVMANEENGVRLLEQEHLVSVFPEGYKGVGKLFRERCRLARFGRGGFVRMALKTGTPMIPVAVVGAEETYVSLAKSPTIARMFGLPYFPISLTWPWLGPLGFVPLPTKWYIDIGEPIPTDGYDPEAASNLVLVSQLTDQVRNIVQEMILDRLANRRSVFFG